MKQIKNLAKIGAGDIIGNVITVGFWFFLASIMNPENYGELHYMLSIAGITSYFALIGSQNTITVYVAKQIPIQSTFNFISIIGGVLGFIVLFVIFQRIDIGFLVLGYIINNLALGEILGKRQYDKYFKYILIQKILTASLGIVLFYSFGLDGVIIGLALSYIAFSIIIVKSFREIKIDFSLFKIRKGFILNNYFNALSGTFHGQIDKILIMPILGAALLGNYSLSLQIISAMMIIASIFYKYMLPQQSAGKNVEQIKKLLIVISIGLSLLGFFIVPIVLPSIFPEYTDATDAIRIMSLAIVPLSFVKIFTSKFLAEEKSRYILIGLIISLSVLIPTMIGFGMLFGINGIASSFVLSTIIQAVYFYIINIKQKREKKIE